MSSNLDLSPKTLREVEFREKLRGYHPDDVDDFLERVAAGLETLLDRLREANDRANRLEARATDRVDDDDSLTRTLVLAQRTADLAVQEAQEVAAQTLAGAEEEARSLLARAESHASDLLRLGEEQLREDVKRLETARTQMLVDLDALSVWMDEERGRLRGALGDALAHIEDAIPVVGAAPQRPPVDIPREGLQWDEPASRAVADPAAAADEAAFAQPDEGAGPSGTTR